jgi:GxxExxY protein
VEINEVSAAIVDAAMKVHSALGPGLLENIYEVCLRRELEKRGLKALSQVGFPVIYEGETLDVGFRVDLLVEDQVIVELKSIEKLAPAQEAQLLTYLRLSGKRLGLLINFGAPHLKDGIKRMVNKL